MPAIDEDDRPKKKISHEIGQDLTLLSVAELTERINLLREEITRTRGGHRAQTGHALGRRRVFQEVATSARWGVSVAPCMADAAAPPEGITGRLTIDRMPGRRSQWIASGATASASLGQRV